MLENEKQINDILGYGEKLKVLVGIDKDTGEDILKEYHFTPVALKKIPALMKMLNVFFKSSGKSDWNEETIEKSAKILKMSLEKMHPDIKSDEIINSFSLGSLAKGISIVMDVNDFLSQMQAMNQKMKNIAPMQ